MILSAAAWHSPHAQSCQLEVDEVVEGTEQPPHDTHQQEGNELPDLIRQVLKLAKVEQAIVGQFAWPRTQYYSTLTSGKERNTDS